MISFKGVFYKLRDGLWNYPDFVYDKTQPIAGGLFSIYKSFRPLSTIVLIVFVVNLLYSTVSLKSLAFVPRNFVETTEIIEGVVVRPDDYPKSLNPLFITPNQIEKDLKKLVFSSLVDLDQNGNPVPAIAESWVIDTDGNIKMKIREDVRWQDGNNLTIDDVLFTINLIKKYGEESSYGKVLQNVEVTKLDQNTFEMKLGSEIPTIFESLSWGIVPMHILGDLTPNEIKRSSFNLAPIGSGPYKINYINDGEIKLDSNEFYYLGKPRIKSLVIRMYSDEELLLEDLNYGKVHLTYSLSDMALNKIMDLKRYGEISSNTLYKRYWALYFNMSEGGNEILKDQKLRKAISVAINKNQVINEALKGKAEVAYGPIQENSWAFFTDLKTDLYNLEESIRLLEEGGWILEEGKNIRSKEGETLTLNLQYIQEENKSQIAKIIKSNLFDVGIDLRLVPHDIDDLNNNVIPTRNFDMLLYGIETSIDPDHYNLWHSSNIIYPGLNISGYKSSVIDGRTGESRLDVMLELARTTNDKEERKKYYKNIQTYVQEDVPVIFLYHPQFTYIVNNRVKNIDISKIASPEDRFVNVYNWEIRI